MGMNTAQLKQLVKDARGSGNATKKQARAKLKRAALLLERNTKRDMPVLTGRAKASWGHWTSQHIRWVEGQKSAYENASDADAVWEESGDGMKIEQGSNVPYVGRLNDGHSRKQSAGFIDRNALEAELDLAARLGEIDPLVADTFADFNREASIRK